MTRRTLKSATADSAVPEATVTRSVSYQVWVTAEQSELIKLAFEASRLTWPEWTLRAIARLMRESEGEVSSLLASWTGPRDGKELLSFRVLPSTLEEAKALAKKHSGTVQAVFAHAHFMEALSVPEAPAGTPTTSGH